MNPHGDRIASGIRFFAGLPDNLPHVGDFEDADIDVDGTDEAGPLPPEPSDFRG